MPRRPGTPIHETSPADRWPRERRSTASVSPAGCLLGALLVLLSCWGTALAQSKGKEGQTIDHLCRQAEHYHRNKSLTQAIQSLEEARKLPGGEQEYRVQMLLARYRHEALELEEAFARVAQAQELAGDEEEDQQATDLLLQMRRRYGGVVLKRADRQRNTKGYIDLEQLTAQVAPEKKQLFEKLRDRLEKTLMHDGITIYLPYGTYLANKVEFTLNPPDDPANPPAFPVVQLYLDPEQKSSGGWWYWVAGGVVVAAGAVVAAILLTQEDETQYRMVLDTKGYAE